MEIYYPTGCDVAEGEYFCEACPPREGARVRSAFFIKKTYTFSNPSSTAEWQQAIEDGNVIVIPETNGLFDGGTPNYATGFGDSLQEYINSDYKVTFRDQNLKNNYAFYEAKKASKLWKFGFRTETLVWISDTVATISPRTPVGEDIKGQVVWENDVTWISENGPEPFDMPTEVFDQCFLVE